MFQNSIPNRKHRIILGAPILFLLLLANNQAAFQGNILQLENENTEKQFVNASSSLNVKLMIDEKTPLNAIGGTISYPNEYLSEPKMVTDGSIVDIWAEAPQTNHTLGKIHFAGGMTSGSGFVGNGKILSINFRVLRPGPGTIKIDSAELLAHDGIGTELPFHSLDYKYYISKTGSASPDMNEDGELSFADIQQTYLSTFRTYNPKYDINGDGKNSWGDVRSLIEIIEYISK